VNTLPQLLNFVMTTLQNSSLCSAVSIVSTKSYSNSQFIIKVRATMADGDNMLQVRFYCNGDHLDYAYQLVDGDTPLMRWDNKEHFPSLTSFPHHFHAENCRVEPSTLIGKPAHDLPIVLEHLRSVNRG